MKSLVIACLLMAACQKQPAADAPLSVSYIIDEYRQGRITNSFTSIHWCRVSPAELRAYQAMSTAPQPICDEPRTIRLIIMPDNQYHKTFQK